MFASIRRYQLRHGDVDDLARRVDTGFADDLSRRPGFVSYEFVDCGDGELTTVSLFRDADGAKNSAALARQWTETSLRDLTFERHGALGGEVLVSRARRHILEPGHPSAGRGYASLRWYRADPGSVPEMMHLVDSDLADTLTNLDGFEAYHAVDCGHGDLFSITMAADRETAERSASIARAFVLNVLAGFSIERTAAFSGRVMVSRAMARVLEPAHA